MHLSVVSKSSSQARRISHSSDARESFAIITLCKKALHLLTLPRSVSEG